MFLNEQAKHKLIGIETNLKDIHVPFFESYEEKSKKDQLDISKKAVVRSSHDANKQTNNKSTLSPSKQTDMN